jgi:acetylornithine deacetylase/succinyl-diaminopimelate desuccinylase-like protein
MKAEAMHMHAIFPSEIHKVDDTQKVIDLVSELVRINSINPWLVPNGKGENEVAQYIADWLAPIGMEVKLEEVEGGRKNLIARLPGSGGGKSLCFYAHLDTVGCALWKDEAFSPKITGDLLYGLGAADDKGHCAAAMLATKSLVEQQVHLSGDVWLAFLIDEEGTSSGAFDFARKYHPDALVGLEPAALGSICITHQGFGWLDIVVKGRAAHGSAPDVGIDAILHMAEVITRLGKLDREKFFSTAHPLNGRTVFHTSTIKGGTDYATYPDSCVLGVEIGTQPGETIANRVAEIESIFREVKSKYPDFNGSVEVKLDRNPFETQGHQSLWDVLAPQIEKELGKPVRAAGENSWGDAAIFQEAGIPTLGIGALGGNFHAPKEWVSVPELGKLIRILEETAKQFCR